MRRQLGCWRMGFVLVLMISGPLGWTAAPDPPGDLLQAVRQCEQAVQKLPNSAQAHLALGIAYLAMDAWDQAAGAFQRAIELDGRSYEAHYWLGRALYLGEKFENAAEHFRQLTQLYPERAEAYADLGLTAYRLHRLDEAEQALHRALERKPGPSPNLEALLPSALFQGGTAPWLSHLIPLARAEIYYYLSLIAQEKGAIERALQACQLSVQLQPSAEAYVQLGLLYLRREAYGEAEAAFMQATRIDPNFAQAHYQLALIYFRQNKNEAATQEMEIFQELQRRAERFKKERDAFARNVDKAPALINLGTLYLQEGRYEEAAREYQKALWYDPQHVQARIGLSHAYALLGHLDKAIQMQQAVVRQHPDLPEAHAGLGFALLKRAEQSGRTEDYQAALEAYRKALVFHQEFPEALYQAGLIALKLNKLPIAEGALTRWLTLMKSSGGETPSSQIVRVHLALGEIALRREQWDQAAAHYQAALDRDPKRVEASYNLGYLAMRQGRLEDALRYLAEVIRQRPNMAQAHYLIGRIYAEQGQYAQAEEALRKASALDPNNALYREGLEAVRQASQKAKGAAP